MTGPGTAPEWYRSALSAAAEQHRVRVGDAEISVRCWGPRGAAGVLLVHGGAAHSHWWDHIAPLLAGERRVAAVDLTGHGDSDRRDRYSVTTWAQEAVAATEAAAMASMPTLIGHSLGGMVCLRAAALHPDRHRAVVVVDSPIRSITPEEQAAREGRAFGPTRTYATKAELVARFRTVPQDEPLPAYLRQRIADQSVREVDGRWSWKFDPRIFRREPWTLADFAGATGHLALLRGERGMLSTRMSDDLFAELGRRAPVIEIPDAGHHVLLDKPLALVSALRALLEVWSTPPAGAGGTGGAAAALRVPAST